MKKLKRLLLSRSFIISIILLILGAIFIAYLFPQKMTSSKFEIEQWLEANPFWAPLYSLLGLDHVYTTPWFASLLALFLFILILSSIEQIKIAKKKTFDKGALSEHQGKSIDVIEERLSVKLKKAGYVRTYNDETGSRFVKHPWGHWGNALLHIGIVLVIGASLLITVTESRGLLHLVEGETYLPGNPWVVEEAGMLAEYFVLPVAVKLDKVEAEYWETDDVKNLSTIISITDTNNIITQYDLGINRTVNEYGLRIYQGRRYGDAFYVEIRDRHGHSFRKIFQIKHPRRRNLPSYENFFIQGIPYMLKVKYFADAGQKSIETINPLLVMRLVQQQTGKKETVDKDSSGKLDPDVKDRDDVIGEVSLRLGESGPLASYTARLVKVTPWSGVIFVRSRGMSGIFIGFFIIIVGVTLNYFMPPREIFIRKENGTCALSWRATKFERFYEDEFNTVLEKIAEKSNS